MGLQKTKSEETLAHPLLQNLHIGHTIQEKEKESSVDAARLRASVETDLCQ